MHFPKAMRAILAAATALVAGAAFAQGFPNKPLKIIVPFPAGGPADLFGRTLAAGMAKELGQPVLVENKSGVGGTLGVDSAIKSEPDGYTLALNSASTVAIAPFSQSTIPYDVDKDFALITTVVRVPEVLVVHPSVPAKNMAEFIKYARANAGKVNFASAGAGTITHLAGELLKVEAKVDIVHVPYKGAAPAISDLLGGQVQMVVLDVPVVQPHIKAGKINAIAVTSTKRASSLPDVPTTAEVGYPGVISDNWYGLVAPAATPAAVQKRLNEAAVKALKSPELVEKFGKVDGIPAPSTPAEYKTFLAAEQAKWGKIVKAIGFKQ